MVDFMFTCSTALAVILCIIPGIVHIQTRNYGAMFMTMWVIVVNVISFVNSLLWQDYNILDDKAEFWCLVIASPFIIAANFGLLASATCTIYTMYSYVASPIILTVRVKRRQANMAFVFTIIIPFIFVGLSYIVQLYKYGIRPIVGCTFVPQQNWVFMVVNNMWPPIIAIIGCYYAGLTAYAIIKKRIEIESLLAYNESGINSSYYYRLVFFCITYLIFALPAALLNTFSNLLEGIVPFDMSGRNFHSIVKFPGESYGVTFVDYAKPLSGFILFFFFGTGQEAMSSYRRWAVAARLISPRNDNNNNNNPPRSSSGILRTHGQTSLRSNGKQSLPQTSLRTPNSFLKDSRLTPPPNIMMGKEKKSGFKNILYMNGHRTPSEQAAFDLTSGLRIKIDGVDTRTVINDDLHERAAPAYQRGIQETLEKFNDDEEEDFGTKRYVETDDDLILEYSTPLPSQPQMSFADGNVSHINHLLAVYDDQPVPPTIDVTPSSPLPQQQAYAMIRVHHTDTFVANGIDDVIDEYSPNRNAGSQRSSYSETGIAL